MAGFAVVELMVDRMDELAQFNAHQEGTRNRLDFLAKSVFLISGAALTLSINLFLGKDAPLLTPCLAWLLKAGWAALFLSIVGYLFTVVVMMMRDYLFGERWRRRLRGGSEDVTGAPGGFDVVMWLLGAFSFCCLVGGLAALGCVSISLVGARS